MSAYKEDPLAKSTIKRWERMKIERATYENNWQDIRDLVRPGAADISRQTTPGQLRTEAMYDGTPPQALEELAGGLNSYLTNPADRWFGLEVDAMRDLQDDIDAQLWLEDTADRIYTEYSHPKVRFSPAMRESYLDLGAFGTCILNQEWSKHTNHILFRTFGLSGCWLDHNDEGEVDTIYRVMKWDSRQLDQAFGLKNLPSEIQRKIQDDRTGDNKYDVLHAVYPRSDHDKGKIDSRNMPFASVWIIVECSATVKESGFTSFPYHVGRWQTIAEEVYGYSPAHKCLPDIRVLNRMEFTILKAAQKATDPPGFVPNDGVMLPIKMSPGSINFYEPNIEDPWKPMEHKGNLPIGLEMSDRRREMIRKAFHRDWVEIARKKERQSIFELQQDEEENIRQIGTILGGIQSDILHPAVARSYELLRDHRRLMPPPPSLRGHTLKVVYVSPAARAQKATKATTLGRFLQDLTPWAQVDPSVLDAVDSDVVTQELADARSVSRRVVRSPEAIAQIRQQRQMAAAIDKAEPVSQALKNVAQARELGLNLEAA
jgi:hypothetical protein